MDACDEHEHNLSLPDTSAPAAQGCEAASAFAAYLRDDQLAVLTEHGPARMMDTLSAVQDRIIPDPPYADLDDDAHDEWTTEFWNRLATIPHIRHA